VSSLKHLQILILKTYCFCPCDYIWFVLREKQNVIPKV